MPLIALISVFAARCRIAHRLSARSVSDRIAWLAFVIAIWVMVGVVVSALLGEGDGDYRSWAQIHRQVRIFVGAGIVGAGVPLLITIWQLPWRRDFRKSTVNWE
jgi:hypothetical protein